MWSVVTLSPRKRRQAAFLMLVGGGRSAVYGNRKREREREKELDKGREKENTIYETHLRLRTRERGRAEKDVLSPYL